MSRLNTMRNGWLLGGLLALVMATGPALAGDDGQRPERPTAVELLLNVNGSQALVGAVLYVDEAGVLDFNLVEFLGDRANRFILFAPVNPAFESLLGFDPGSLAGLSAEAIRDALGGLVPAEDVASILLKHVVLVNEESGPRPSETALIAAGTTIAADGSELSFGIGATGATVNQATIIKSNVRTSNGMIQFIDSVL